MAQNTDRTILVAGGAGYIGSHTCKALAAAGFLPVTFDNLATGHREFVRWGPLEVGDIRDPVRLSEALAAHRPAGIVHFAAHCYVGDSVTEPAKYYDNNVAGSICLLNAVREAGIAALVFSSSCAVYGVPDTLPISETVPKNPINPYGRTKLMIEQAMEDYSRAYDLRFMALRYFNAAGADDDGEIGERHDPETHLIPRAVLAALGADITFGLYGDDYPTPDGTAIRDYIHVGDLADAHVRALRYLLDGGASDAVNLGTGIGASIRDVIRAVAAELDTPVPHVVEPRRPGDPPELVARPLKARDVLGFSPIRSSLKTIVRSACRWHRKELSTSAGQ